jgi:hypothetical protein
MLGTQNGQDALSRKTEYCAPYMKEVGFEPAHQRPAQDSYPAPSQAASLEAILPNKQQAEEQLIEDLGPLPARARALQSSDHNHQNLNGMESDVMFKRIGRTLTDRRGGAASVFHLDDSAVQRHGGAEDCTGTGIPLARPAQHSVLQGEIGAQAQIDSRHPNGSGGIRSTSFGPLKSKDGVPDCNPAADAASDPPKTAERDGAVPVVMNGSGPAPQNGAEALPLPPVTVFRVTGLEPQVGTDPSPPSCNLYLDIACLPRLPRLLTFPESEGLGERKEVGRGGGGASLFCRLLGTVPQSVSK